MKRMTLLMEIDDLHIKLACREELKTEKISRYFEIIASGGVIVDGQINDKDRFQQILKGYLLKHKVKVKQVRIILKSEKILLKYDTILNVLEKELENAIHNNIEKYFPMDISDYTVDYKRISESRILVVALPEKIICDYISVLSALRLVLVKVDIFQNCVAKVFAKMSGNILLLYKNENKLDYIYLTNGLLHHSKEIKISEHENIAEILSRLDNQRRLHLKLDKVFILSENMESVSEYFCYNNIPCELYSEASNSISEKILSKDRKSVV